MSKEEKAEDLTLVNCTLLDPSASIKMVLLENFINQVKNNCISPSLEYRATFSFCFVVNFKWAACVQRKFEGVYLIKNHRNNHLFSYYKLGFRCY